MAKIFRVAGDTGEDVTFQQEGVDITGFTGAMNILYESGDTESKTGSIANAATGDWIFPFDAGDLVEGSHRIEFEITDTSAEIVTYPSRNPIRLIVRGGLC